jgi:hypothetical protein
MNVDNATEAFSFFGKIFLNDPNYTTHYFQKKMDRGDGVTDIDCWELFLRLCVQGGLWSPYAVLGNPNLTEVRMIKSYIFIIIYYYLILLLSKSIPIFP